jgi:histidinol-phosphate aminotransferase
MSNKMTRRQWLSQSGIALGGTALAGYWGVSHTACVSEQEVSHAPLRMMYNENPYGPSETARKAMREAFEEANLYTFSRGEAYTKLRSLIAQQVGLTPDHIVISAGSTEILRAAALITALKGGEVLAPHPTFLSLTRYAETMGVKVHWVPVDEDLQFDLPAMRKKLTKNVKLIYLVNPNNPTGTLTPYDRLRPFCEEMAKDMLVFVDEAYHEYVTDPQYRSMVELVREGHNVIVSRTASKIHGLAGVRVGFGIADPKLIRYLGRRLTGTNNIIGLNAALASYQDEDFQKLCHQKNNEAKEYVYKLFRETERRYLPSHTNFVFFHTGRPIEEFQDAMEKQGILVGRPFPPYLDWCRLSMTKPEWMGNFGAAFQKVMG